MRTFAVTTTAALVLVLLPTACRTGGPTDDATDRIVSAPAQKMSDAVIYINGLS